MNISAANRPKSQIYGSRDAEGEITQHITMVRMKTEEKQLKEGPKSPEKKKNWLDILFILLKIYTTKIIRKKIPQ